MSKNNKNQVQKTLNKDDNTLIESYYKSKYWICFYTPDEEEQYIIGFSGVRDICKYLKQDMTNSNISKIRCMLYQSLKSDTHVSYLLGKKMRVHLVNMKEDIE